MKANHLTTTFAFLLAFIPLIYSQEQNCKVLKPEIAAKYTGECKKGLANGKGIAEGTDLYDGKFKNGLPHGKGLYRYANGEIYEGDFKNGMKDGNGKFSFKYLGKDSSYSAVWKEGHFIKKITPPPYQIIQSLYVARSTVMKVGEGNRIMFTFMQNGTDNYSITDLSFAGNAGTSLNIGRDQGYDNISFPFTCKVMYVTSNSLRTASYRCVFEVQINQPGQWQVTLYN
ncbi:MAG: hypothetical protein WAO52_06395 [Prolixibacteraceae bacterium]